MSKNTSIILGEHFDEFIKKELKSGRFKSASEIIRSGLRLLELERKKIDLINESLVEGEESGEPRKFDNEAFKKKMSEKMKQNG